MVVPTGANLALHKPAIQSTTYHANGVASHGVDGNDNVDYGIHSCTHTLKSNHPWWRVDLGSSKKVSRVDIFNRADCCTDRLKNFEVRVGKCFHLFKVKTACFSRDVIKILKSCIDR